jgi:hypothetical protein
MLNFNAQEIINANNKQTQFANVLNQQINASGGTWFAFQYEIAYDANIANTTFPNLGLEWASEWVSVSTVILNGSQTGSIKGMLGNPNQSGFNFGSFLQKGVVSLLGASSYATYLSLLDNSPNSAGAYTKAMQDAGNGLVKGFLNGVLGGASGTSPQPLSLTINSSIKLNGNIITNGGLENMKLAFPGQANSQTADGNTPAYNNIMGVFNISNTPTVNVSSETYQTGPYEDPYDGSFFYSHWQENKYTLNNNSFNIIWNPAIINTSTTGATIQNLKTQIVQLEVGYISEIPTLKLGGEANPGIRVVTGYFSTLEQIGGYYAATSIPNSTVPLVIDFPYQLISPGQTAVRISFDVVPNNGAPKSTIVKTFNANVQ